MRLSIQRDDHEEEISLAPLHAFDVSTNSSLDLIINTCGPICTLDWWGGEDPILTSIGRVLAVGTSDIVDNVAEMNDIQIYKGGINFHVKGKREGGWNVLQVWGIKEGEGRMVVGLGHDFGPVWDLKWVPGKAQRGFSYGKCRLPFCKETLALPEYIVHVRKSFSFHNISLAFSVVGNQACSSEHVITGSGASLGLVAAVFGDGDLRILRVPLVDGTRGREDRGRASEELGQGADFSKFGKVVDAEIVFWGSENGGTLTCLEFCREDPSLLACGVSNGAVVLFKIGE